MHLIVQIFFTILGAGSAVLDYFMINCFRRDQVHMIYRYFGEYTEIAELVIYIMLLYISAFVQLGGIKTDLSKSVWRNVTTVFVIIGTLESLARLAALIILSIHIQPGKKDFMGLFLVIMILYLVMKYGLIFALGMGIDDNIKNVKTSKLEDSRLKIYKYA
eukprot:TRINITY_DN4514_c0_g1_i7.p1 TRINITY_DN4514_c0_g1~~TRINITY_DN4514_c0_g1_i7.p1  ORF type:complete len:161 (+),score=30.21 TRINITY_DN4514_c0_g1_i7:191-673(+)